jgi:gamma-carbonic anhydrase
MSGNILSYGDKRPRIAADAFVAPTAMIIGDVEIGSGASIWFGCVLRGDVNSIRIGARTNIQDGTIIHGNHESEEFPAKGVRTVIGSDVTVGHMAVLHACTVEDGGFVGIKACLLDGSYVESRGMVAAGALVTPGKRVRRGELWAGSPAKLLRSLTQVELDYFPYSARHYRELADSYRTDGG